MYTVSEYFRGIFGKKVQKIAVDAGLGCPNRDGTLGTGGCIYCNNAAFNPGYAAGTGHSISRQIEDGKKFFARKTSAESAYLAYFQSFTNTYGDTSALVALYEEALSSPGIEGLVIATRPDCLKPDLLEWMSERFGRDRGKPYLLVELGIESTDDETLRRINRGHDFACAQKAVRELDARGIPVGAHIILGLPGETADDFDRHADRLSELPVGTVKLHQLQIIKGTALARQYAENPQSVRLFTPEEYARAAARFVSRLRPGIAIDRMVSETPPELLVAPRWGLKPDKITAMIEEYI